jgi:hypothetical protein
MEQTGDEAALSLDVVSAAVLNLPLPGHRDRFKARQGSQGRPESAKPVARPHLSAAQER